MMLNYIFSFNSGGFQKISNVSGDVKLNSIVRNHEFKISPNLPEYNSPKKTHCNTNII